jgi:hypothetical protein
MQKYSQPTRDVYKAQLQRITTVSDSTHELNVNEIIQKYRFDGDENYSWVKQK